MRRPSIIGDEQGVAAVMVVLCMPFLLLFCVFAIDVANWFVHKRHLQTQADAAALAGAREFRLPCVDAPITDMALRYSGKGDGVETHNGPTYGTTDPQLFAEINKENYHDQATPSDAEFQDQNASGPCETATLDVKMTETDVPWFFGTLGVDFINARARVKLFDLDRFTGVLPLGVQEVSPRVVRTFVVDESKAPGAVGYVLATDTLDQQSGGGGGTVSFDNEASAMSLALSTSSPSRLGVRIGLSGDENVTDCSSGTLDTCYTTFCGTSLSRCYDNSGTTGLSFIRAWEGKTASPDKPPELNSVQLTDTDADCGNPSFSGLKVACDVGLSATVAFNSAVTDPSATTTGTKKQATLVAKVAGSNTAYPMTHSSVTGRWTTTDTLPVPAATTSSTQAYDIEWRQNIGKIDTPSGQANKQDCTSNAASNCEGTFTSVQRHYANNPTNAAAGGGPIATLEVKDGTPGPSLLTAVSDLQRCASTCNYSLIVDVALKGQLALSDPGDPPISLRVADGQSGSLDCEETTDFTDEIIRGCNDDYAVHTSGACPSVAGFWSNPRPLTCALTQPGEFTNKGAKALNERILCPLVGCSPAGKPNSCPPAGSTGHNNYNGGVFPEGDPRVLPVFLVPFGSFEASGNKTVPIIDFAFFYMTGWNGSNAVHNPCQDDGDDVVSDEGEILGHFVRYTAPNTGGSGENACQFDDPSDVGGCVAVLVK